ncbi:hypothetical protein FRZ06_20670 [Anoxybacterium hadale]|uniref:Uncharacterized protein n=1 Tax=Anoxybacterium hadale TaxID=3408580 RepID=A0ACD1AHJ2_9FIRM|nr:hypothetical protein FRZ06_20670 [Clostridiales bacterium]
MKKRTAGSGASQSPEGTLPFFRRITSRKAKGSCNEKTDSRERSESESRRDVAFFSQNHEPKGEGKLQ